MSELNIIKNQIITDNNNFFFAGDDYLKYISFIGCSPYLNFIPQTEIILSDLKETIADLNYVQFSFNQNHYSFRKTDFGVKAICPDCRERIVDWNSLIINWEQNSNSDSLCPQCSKQISIFDIDWRKTAGFFKTAILFHGIQADLAAPVDELLIQLEYITQVKWLYFNG